MRCKINKKMTCGYGKCWPGCDVMRQTQQQTLFPLEVETTTVEKKKGHTVRRYKVKPDATHTR